MLVPYAVLECIITKTLPLRVNHYHACVVKIHPESSHVAKTNSLIGNWVYWEWLW